MTETQQRIAVDAMGGDDAPEAIVAGALRAAQANPAVEIQLYGDEAAIKQALADKTLPTNIVIIHAPEKIASDDEPVRAIRQKKDASMVMAARAVKAGEADAFISAGNSGALLASGLLIVGRMKGIERPGFMATLPNLSQIGEQWLLIDSGANTESKAKHLVQYARMGYTYAQVVQQKPNPSVGLLNNGSEASKGNDLTKAAYDLLAAEESIRFVGNIEARDVLAGAADVVVADGFTGNAVLKAVEGTSSQVMHVIKDTLKSGGLGTKMGALLIQKQLKATLKDLDYNKAGGAILFGVKAPVIKCHGSANADNIFYGIQQAVSILDAQIVPELTDIFADQAKQEKGE